MKLALVALTILSFVGVAVFGLYGMAHSNSHGHSGCLAAVAERSDCPGTGSALDFIAFHLEALKSFSQATFDGVNAGALALILLYLFAVTAAFYLVRITSLQISVIRRWQFNSEPYITPAQDLTRWLSLHENSPTRS